MPRPTVAKQRAEQKSRAGSANRDTPENVFNATVFGGDSDGFSADGTRHYGEEESNAGFGARPSGPDFLDPHENPAHEQPNPYSEGSVLRRLALQAKRAGEEAAVRHQKQRIKPK